MTSGIFGFLNGFLGSPIDIDVKFGPFEFKFDTGTSNNAPCYASGTLIRTVRGSDIVDIVVEDLQVGDLVLTTSGAHRPIKWIGHRALDCRQHPRPLDVMPVRIAAHAFGPNKPARDLYVSPGHAICVDVVGEVLIPVNALINGATVAQVDVDAVTYWHVELDSHDVILAENLPAESYLDMGNRVFFTEGEVVQLDASPDADPALLTHAEFCRTFCDAGPIVEVVRARMRASAEDLGWHLNATELFEDTYLEVDGQLLEPKVRGNSACFVLPATSDSIWLVSPTTVPREVGDNADARALALNLSGLHLDDGLGTPRSVALDDPLLCIGFHGAESGHRWTVGRAKLPAALLDGLEGTIFLRVDLASESLPRWAAPAASRTEDGHDAVRLAV